MGIIAARSAHVVGYGPEFPHPAVARPQLEGGLPPGFIHRQKSDAWTTTSGGLMSEATAVMTKLRQTSTTLLEQQQEY
ncbi:MAG TPA: hypothetical protein VE400_19445, partial [Mycobacterium sp.]|nr:hypothetical protein [Mycobacterium sp.]